MRLIDADAFKEYIRGACEEMSHVYKDGGEWAKQITEDFCMDIDEQPTIEERKTRTWTTEEVAEMLFNMFGEECACNFNGIDEWLPECCKYAETTCPEPKEKHGCWMQFLLQCGADMRGEEDG